MKIIQLQKEWMSFKTITEEYADLGENTLRKYLNDPVHPLPAKRVNGKFLVHRHEFDTWLRGFPGAGENTDRLVEELMKGIGQ